MSDFDYGARVARAKALMAEDGLDAMLLSVGADLPYFTGYEAMATERLTMAVIPRDGEATVVVPLLEAPRVRPQPGVFRVRSWEETDDPVAMVADLVGERSRLAFGDHTWAVFLIRLQAALPTATFVSAAALTRELRMRKGPGELAALHKAGSAADRVAARLRTMSFSGMTEVELAHRVEVMCLEEGHDEAWQPIVASGPNAASPHHHSGKRVMAEGDGVVVDFGGRADGYHSDTTRTFHIGEPPEAFAEAYAVLHAAQAAARAMLRPGITAESVDEAARTVIAGAGYGEFFIHRTGHGIGLEVHEHPYLVAGNAELLEPGMTFSIEPGIYVPDRFGMRIEDIAGIAETGGVVFNDSPRDLAIVS